MIILLLCIFGLCFGSFINALIWRIHNQARSTSKKKQNELSILRGRSMCMHCRHTLQIWDLVPVVSWVLLKGRCRYCHKPYPDSPVAEILTPLLFLISYIFWPYSFNTLGISLFIFWLIFLVGFIALALYDLRWYLLPNRIIFPLYWVALLQVLMLTLFFGYGFHEIILTAASIGVGGGIFYVLYKVSMGKWIGGGDVKLGFLVGAILGDPLLSILYIFVASLVGTVYAAPLLLSGRLKRTSHLPFGPFLIISAYITVIFGQRLLDGYMQLIGL